MKGTAIMAHYAPDRPTTAWPTFPIGGWAETGPTLHRWTQVVGKIRMALSAPMNHYWHTPLYVSARGLTTSAIPYGSELFEIEFDLLHHQLVLSTSWGPTRMFPLAAYSVAHFYAQVMAALDALRIDVRIWPKPVEIADPIPFDQDRTHASYDPEAAHALWQTLIQADRVLKTFRGRFLGKCSPVHFFWGGFDLAVTRFSGRRGPLYAGSSFNVGPHVMHESYSHEVSSAGFWPGNQDASPMFYSYAVPEPAGFRSTAVATYDDTLGEFVLPYADVQSAERPDERLLEFLESTYASAADLGGWDRVLLEQRPPCACDNRGEPRS